MFWLSASSYIVFVTLEVQNRDVEVAEPPVLQMLPLCVVVSRYKFINHLSIVVVLWKGKFVLTQEVREEHVVFCMVFPSRKAHNNA